MKVTKWVYMGAEVEIEIGAGDIRSALAEAFSAAQDKLAEHPTRYDILRSLNMVAEFLNGLTDEQIATLLPAQSMLTEKFLRTVADRFKVLEVPANA